MTAADVQQLFPLRRQSPGMDAAEALLASLGQTVIPASDATLPANLRPDATRDRAPIRRAPERRLAPRERVDRASVNAQASIKALVDQSGYLAGRNTGTCPECGKGGLDVNERRNTAHCYRAGCEFQSVSPIDWLMRVDGYGFLEAVAVITGQPLPERSEPRQPLTVAPRAEIPAPIAQRPFTPLANAAKGALWAQETPVAVNALEYLLSRGFSGDELELMGVGVADSTVPDSLLPLNKEGRTSLMWRNRVIIPTWNGSEAINLKARTLEEKTPENAEHYKKYLNVYGGSAELIGLESLGGQMPETIVLTEGELDWWTLRVLMPELPAVAVRGLANLGPEQAQAFAGCRVIVLLDADTHGSRMLLGDLAGQDDGQVREKLEGEGQKFGAAIEGRRLVKKLLSAGAMPLIAETGIDGDLNDLLANLDRDDAREIIAHAVANAAPVRKQRRLS